jgi:hypothetical protein
VRVVQKIVREKRADLEAWELGLRAAVHAGGARVLEKLLHGVGAGRSKEPVLCDCGRRMESQGLRKKEVLTVLGRVVFRRSLYTCPACGASRYPGDEALDIVGTTRSPGVRRLMAMVGGQSTFQEAAGQLKKLAGILVSLKDVERVAEGIGEDAEKWAAREREVLRRAGQPLGMEKSIPVLYVCADGTGVPMTGKELKGRKGKQVDGSAKTREAKLGCVFTQTTTDKEGYAVRDPESTSYVGSIETAEVFGDRLFAESVRRGLWKAKRVVVIGDGAEWIRNLAEMHFPFATVIVDLYHAREHVTDLCKALFPNDQKQSAAWRRRWWKDLDEGRVEKIIRQAQARQPRCKEVAAVVRAEIGYLEKNKSRMRYAEYRQDGLFVGSGVLEAGCKTIVGQRLKNSGMRWTVRGANAIISLRCMLKSRRMDDYWESRLAA